MYPRGAPLVVRHMRGLTCVAPLLALLAGASVTGVSRAATATEVGGSRNLGLGLGLGTATSLVGKYFIDRGSALDFGVSFFRYRHGCWRDRRGVVYCDGYGDTYRNGSFGLHLDYLWQDTLARRSAKLDWHIGAGARLWHWDADDYYYYYYRDSRSALAARMPLGLDLTFVRPDFLEVYLEAAPSLYFVPFVELDVEAFVGVRFYF
jgi:hypothetical protein